MKTIMTYKPGPRLINYHQIMVVNERRRLNYDPTRTTVLRQAFTREMSKRFNQLAREIREAIIDKDVFGLVDPVRVYTIGEKAFRFKTSQQKVDGFMEWIKERQKAGVLKTTTIPQLGTSIEQPWTNLYIEDSYKRGVMRATAEMKKLKGIPQPGFSDETIQATMANPFHAERVGVLYSRVFEELKGITSQMDTQISRVLSEGLVNGDNPRLLARKLNKVITGSGADLGIKDSLGRFIPAKRRAETLARTEVIRAHHQATVQQYKNWGLEGVVVKAEWSTAGDDRVCDECSGMHGNVYTLKEIESMIPRHPNCRCIALPSLVEEKVTEKTLVQDDTWEDMVITEKQRSTFLDSPSEFIDGIQIDLKNSFFSENDIAYRLNLIGRTINEDIITKLPGLRDSARYNPVKIKMTGDSGSNVMASYMWDRKQITFFQNGMARTTYTPAPTLGTGSFLAAGATLPSTIAHEFGHHVHRTLLSPKSIKKWDTFYHSKGPNYFTNNVSRYSSTNEAEAFAETFSAYIHPGYKKGELAKDIEKLMESLIGKRSDL